MAFALTLCFITAVPSGTLFATQQATRTFLEERRMHKKLKTTVLAVSLSLISTAGLADSSTFSGATKDAWITGKIETAFVLNGHLNPFAIDTDVEGGIVRLS
jgi:osmotically-inducible protein OsmY